MRLSYLVLYLSVLCSWLIDSFEHLYASKKHESEHGERRKSIHHEAWNVSSKSNLGVTDLVDDASKGVDHEADSAWEWEKEEAKRQWGEDGKTVFQEVVDTSVSTVVVAKISVLM